MEEPPRRPGIYALIIEVPSPLRVKVGSLGAQLFSQGCYVYIGSAKGPGGLRARVLRHLSAEKRVKWHIDYLLTSGARVFAAVYAEERGEPECVLTPLLEERGFKHWVPGFGSSDCKRGCRSHLLACPLPCPECLGKVEEVFRVLGLKPKTMVVKN